MKIPKISCDVGCGCYDDLLCDRYDAKLAKSVPVRPTALEAANEQVAPLGMNVAADGNVTFADGMMAFVTDSSAGAIAHKVSKALYGRDFENMTKAGPKVQFAKVYSFKQPKDLAVGQQQQQAAKRSADDAATPSSAGAKRGNKKPKMK
jgi:hypothetical protein